LSRVLGLRDVPAVAHGLDTASTDRIAELPGVTERLVTINWCRSAMIFQVQRSA
jgi:hypothetical protein